MQLNSRHKPRVRLVAICKDEGAYVAEWIHHHFYFGVDSIKIYVNRTSDNTVEILQEIQKNYPYVEYEIVDWVDFLPGEVTSKLQYICYAKDFGECRIAGSFDYILFLDIDEFWTPKDLNTSVQDVVSHLNHPDCISFQWFNEEGSKYEFSSLSQSIKGGRHPLVKSMIKVEAELKRVGFHFPELFRGTTLLSNGDSYKFSKASRSVVHPSLDKNRDIMIVHRMFRSPLEYLATIVKSNPEKYSAVKLNRRGYNRLQTANKEKLTLDKTEFKKYFRSYSAFLEKVDCAHLIKEAEQFVRQRAKLVVEKSKLTKLEHLPDLLVTLGGCENELLTVINEMGSFECVKTTRDRKTLVEVALKLEKVSIEAAKALWKRAYEIHPDGPLIVKKCQEYDL